jgi:hypothetical protein
MVRVYELISAQLKIMLYFLLGMFLSVHGKRILLLTTLHMGLVRDGIFREETLSKLNQKLGLAKFDKALLLPQKYHESIVTHERLHQAVREVLKHGSTDVHLSHDQMRQLSEALLRATPEWLHYENSLDDVMMMFQRQSGELQTT